MYERYARLRDEKGLTDAKVSKLTGISKATLSQWKSGLYVPKRDKIKKIADLLDVSVSYLVGEESDGYYINEETAKIAQEIFENPELRVLFSASRDASPEDLLYVSDLLLKLKRAENR